ncbi:MAG: hypothetical protein V7K92_18580 [Nostoc sp.]|uniref:hypothetical protein n=1 Tax=Nostoc sp. TaxID=1180 RepID=UPI002FF37250
MQAIFIALIREIGDGEVGSTGLFTSTSIDWQRARSPVCLIAHHKITALLTPLPHGRRMMLNVAIRI